MGAVAASPAGSRNVARDFDGTGGSEGRLSFARQRLAFRRSPIEENSDDSNSAQNSSRSAYWRGASATRRATLNHSDHGEPRPHSYQNQMAGGRRIGSPSR